MYALGLVMLSLLSGFGIMYLIGLLGVDTSYLIWIPVLSTAPAVVFAMFAVVHDEAKREAHFRDMSTLVADALLMSTGIELTERDIRKMVDGDVITDAAGGSLHIDKQVNGRNTIMTLIRDGGHEDPVQDELDQIVSEIKADTKDAHTTKFDVHGTSTAMIPVQQQKVPFGTPQKPESAPENGKGKAGEKSGATPITAVK
jgi:hypothetical protein